MNADTSVPRTPADGMRPPALRRTARTLARVAAQVKEAGPLWADVLRAGLRQALRTRTRWPSFETAADANAWRMASRFADLSEAPNPEDVARTCWHAAAHLRAMAHDLERGRLAVTETTTRGGTVLAIQDAPQSRPTSAGDRR